MEPLVTSEPSKSIPLLVQMVLDGKKPGAYIDDLSGVEQFKSFGLDVISTGPAWRDVTLPENCLVIAKKQKVKDALTHVHLPLIPRLQSRVDSILSKINDLSVAETLVLLNQMPRVDDEYDIEISNLERPEVALLEGVLLGYKSCCVTYYISTRYLKVPRDETSEQINNEHAGENSHIRCPTCVAANQFD
jgi:hypothetical protein